MPIEVAENYDDMKIASMAGFTFDIPTINANVQPSFASFKEIRGNANCHIGYAYDYPFCNNDLSSMGKWLNVSGFQQYGSVAMSQMTFTGAKLSRNSSMCFSVKFIMNKNPKPGISPTFKNYNIFAFGSYLNNPNRVPFLSLSFDGVFSINGVVASVPIKVSDLYRESSIEIVSVGNGTSIDVSFYVNNIKIGSFNDDKLDNMDLSIRVAYGNTNSASSTANGFKDNVILCMKDTVISNEAKGVKPSRVGDSFYVSKLHPVADVTTEWDGDKPHYSKLVDPNDSSQFVSGYRYGQKEEFKMGSSDKIRGSVVLGVTSSVYVTNTGSVPAEMESIMMGIPSEKTIVNTGDSTIIRQSYAKNPLTEAGWKVSDLESVTGGFAISEEE